MARPRQIDRATVLRASLAVADERGVDALTMQAVAERLGVTPMALYRHVENKQDLLDGIVESLLDEIAPPSDDQPWDEQLSSMGQACARRRGATRPSFRCCCSCRRRPQARAASVSASTAPCAKRESQKPTSHESNG